MDTRFKTQLEIAELLDKNYRSVRAIYCYYENESVTITLNTPKKALYPFIAKRILDKFSEVRWVYFTGGFQTYVYSRETLKYGGYYGK